MKKILALLNTKHAALACIVVAVLCRIINLLFFSFAGRDKMILVLQSKSFLDGNGFSVPKYFTNQLDVPYYDYTQLWPPGYSFTLAPFLKLFNYNVYWATSVLDIFAAVALIFVVRKICRQVSFPPAATNIMTLITGCFEYPFTNQSLPTDTISIMFMLLAVSFALKVTEAKEISYKQIFVTAFLLFLPCFYRYAYPPVSMGVPAVIILYAWLKKDKLLLRKGFLMSVITFAMIVLFFIILKSFTGQAGYITPTEKGYFPENLIHWYPVVPSSFIDFPFFTMQVLRSTGIDLPSQYLMMEVINTICIVILIALFFYFLFIKKTFREITPVKWLILWSWVCSAIIFITLGWLSFSNKQQVYSGFAWNYVYEARYFGLAIVLIQILYLSWCFLSYSWKHIWWQKIILIFCAVFLFVEISHSVYFNTKMLLNFKENKLAIFREMDYNYFNALLPKLEKENPGYEILVAATGDDFFSCAAAYAYKKGIFDGTNLNSGLPKVKTKSLLLVMLYDSELYKYQLLITNPKTKKLNNIATCNFFLLELNP